jgi:hypothetical protein
VKAPGASLDCLAPLADCANATSLRSAVSELCGRFGTLRQIDVLTVTEAEHRRALCFLKLDSPAEESEMMAALGITRFGEDLLLVVDLHEAPAAD